nr:MAG TPA: hypothetical protein [Caudoviricetes sp.]
MLFNMKVSNFIKNYFIVRTHFCTHFFICFHWALRHR